jgi:glycosyltransferase involved in cell wall biosynthesis
MPEPPKLKPIASEPLSVVLLAHNPGGPLESIVGAWSASLDKHGRDYELLLVDDGSSDGSGERAVQLTERYPRLKVLHHETQQGEGAALRTAIAASRHPLFFYTLCDPRFKPADLEQLLTRRPDSKNPRLEIDQVHLMSAIRAGQPVPLPLRFVGLCGRILCRVVLCHWPEPLPGWLGWRASLWGLAVRAMFGVRYRDASCPFRLIRREIFARLPLQSDGSFVHVELVAKANFLGHVLGGEMPLAAGHQPPVTDYRQGTSIKEMMTDIRRVLFHADFGPPLPSPLQTSEAKPEPPATGEVPAPGAT